MIEYCTGGKCLRAKILRYFGEQCADACGGCSNCDKPRESVDATQFARAVFELIRSTGGYFGVPTLSHILKGAAGGKSETPVQKYSFRQEFGMYSEWTALKINEWANALIDCQYLIHDTEPYHRLRLTPMALEVLSGTSCTLDLPKEITGEITPSRRERRSSTRKPVANINEALYERLRALRQSIAIEQKVPAYVVFSNATLNDMCIKIPVTAEQFLDVIGVGEHKARQYGHAFLTEIRTFSGKQESI